MTLIAFILFNILAIELPGFVLYRTLFKRNLTGEIKLLASYFLGMMLLFVEYLIETEAKVPYFTEIASLLMICIWLYTFVKNESKRQEYLRSVKVDKILYPLFLIVWIYGLLAYTYPYVLAPKGNSIQVYHDYLFHVGNIVSLSRSFFQSDIRVYGLIFNYHYFYDLVYAICKHMTGLDAFNLLMWGTPLISAFWLSLAMTVIGQKLERQGKYLGRQYRGMKRLCLYGSLMVCLVMMLPVVLRGERFPVSGLNREIMTNANASGMAITLVILISVLFMEVWHSRISIKEMLALVLLTMALTGVKGPSAAIMLAALWAVAVVESIIARRLYGWQKLTLILSSAAFGLVYKVVDSGINVTEHNANRAMEFTLTESLRKARASQLFERLGFDCELQPWLTLGLIVMAITIMGPCILSFICQLGHEIQMLIKEKKVNEPFKWFCIAITLIGVGGTVLINIEGFSQQYCALTAAAFYLYLVITQMQRKPKSLVRGVTLVGLYVGLAVLFLDLAYNIRVGVIQNASYSQEYNDESDRVSSLEMEGYRWIKNNTSEDAVIATDRYDEKLDYRKIFLYAGAFSERQIFLEGYSYSNVSNETAEKMLAINESFYDSDTEKAYKTMKEYGINYLVVSRVEHPDYVEYTEKEPVFENDDMAIYCVE